MKCNSKLNLYEQLQAQELLGDAAPNALCASCHDGDFILEIYFSDVLKN